jgi:hypothetical protein
MVRVRRRQLSCRRCLHSERVGCGGDRLERFDISRGIFGGAPGCSVTEDFAELPGWGGGNDGADERSGPNGGNGQGGVRRAVEDDAQVGVDSVRSAKRSTTTYLALRSEPGTARPDSCRCVIFVDAAVVEQ